MSTAHSIRRTVRFAACLGAVAFAIGALPVFANPISKLPGRWAGWGAVTLLNGETERVKCVVTYFVKNGGASVRQNLRCASSNYKIDTIADLAIAGTDVTGKWQERTHSNSGSVTGKVTEKGIDLAVKSETFTAKMSLTTGKCKQSISFVPTDLDISRISIGLRKC